MARLRAGGDGSLRALGMAVDPRAVKVRLFEKLGSFADEYWQLLGALCTAAIDRAEFHNRVKAKLPSECVPLHNALVLSILAEANSGSSASAASGTGASVRALTSPIQPRRAVLNDSTDESDDKTEPPVDGRASRGLKPTT